MKNSKNAKDAKMMGFPGFSMVQNMQKCNKKQNAQMENAEMLHASSKKRTLISNAPDNIKKLVLKYKNMLKCTVK